MRKRSKHSPSTTDLKRILGALEEIEWHFGNEGFDSEWALETESTESDEDDNREHDEEERWNSGPEVFDAEEIEVAIDAFISRLANDGLINKPKLGKAPSLSRVFAKLFGANHQIVELAETFEECVKGYIGWVGYDDMQKAYETFVELKGAIEEAANGSAA